MQEDLGSFIKRALEEAMRERSHINVLIAGKSGVGKSTLINAVFQGRMAHTGQGRPVTKSTTEISKEGIPLSIWDTRGLELAAFQETLSELEQLVLLRASDRDASRHIHVAWLCIQEDGRRVEDAEITLQNTLAKHIPVLAVITKARKDVDDDGQSFRAEVRRLLPLARNAVRVRSIAEVLDDGHSMPVLGLEDLVNLTAEVIPEGHRRALAAAQKVSIDYKRKVAHGIVATAAAAAAAAGASPIPFSDAFILVPIQVGMLAGISATFGLDLSKAFLSTLASTLLGSGGATLAGKTIVTNLLKLVPGVQILGMVINGATAAALTTGVGEAFIAILAALYAESAGEAPSPEAVEEALRKRLNAK